ncbi:hypothetical protein [Sporolactobacillus terrae]|uniref:Uncharacterized protein n=1 Tax=Sporolactobacillus terrae TaxID=269673 RepID=A0A5K7WXZ6_9BACL|nr:hypothetical protein [Sporolactobacillus terrae]BBN99172.1 hypothetical protein St703_18770 [Sporolactobacillus terrae]
MSTKYSEAEQFLRYIKHRSEVALGQLDNAEPTERNHNKPYDIHVNSVLSIPDILVDGQILHDGRHGLADFCMHWQTNEDVVHETEWQALFAEMQFDKLVVTFFKGIGEHAELHSVPSSISTCEEAERWLNSHGDS